MSKEDPAEIIQLLKDYTFNKINRQSGKDNSRVNLPWSSILLNALDWVHNNKMKHSILK